MTARHLPVRPDLNELRAQATALLRALHDRDAAAMADLAAFHPQPPAPEQAQLADAELTIARSHDVASWPRLELACRLVDAIWQDDLATVVSLVEQHPQLIHENARGTTHCNWGPPLSHAANLGRDAIIAALHQRGATDLPHALDRAVLQGQITTARALHAMMGRPAIPVRYFDGAAYTLNVDGTRFLLELGALLRDEHGAPRAPVDVVIQSDSRKPAAKHEILELYAANGITLPDTPMMALHRGRIDLLERHLERDPALLTRTFTYDDVFPAALRCEPQAEYEDFLPRTPVAGMTLLHACVEFDELSIAEWLLQRGMDANARATIDAKGFGGQTPLFHAVVCYANFWLNFTGRRTATETPGQSGFADLLLAHGADSNARASFREPIGDAGHRTWREHRDITPVRWGTVFDDRMVVSTPALQAVAAHGGHE
jgi:hypothetical protein